VLETLDEVPESIETEMKGLSTEIDAKRLAIDEIS
jgi:hypothetical protein